MLNRLDFLDGDHPISEEFQVFVDFYFVCWTRIFYFYNCNSVYSKRTSDLGVPSKLAKLLDFIDLMKSVDFDQGGRNANEDKKWKNSEPKKAKTFIKHFEFWKILDSNIAEKSSIRVPF